MSAYVVSMPHAAIPFRPHHRFAVPLPRSRRGGLVTRRFLVKSRNISFPRRCGGGGERSEPMGALMPHAALWVVQPVRELVKDELYSFNVARGFVGGAAAHDGRGRDQGAGFNAARGFVGGATFRQRP
ncbi:hypothetical protein ADJ74_00560 [Selenomonas sp. oral taxon 478]|nr:hypothetical protein ADJ74_00560 [Selenomonas sp. oral taxon 478]